MSNTSETDLPSAAPTEPAAEPAAQPESRPVLGFFRRPGEAPAVSIEPRRRGEGNGPTPVAMPPRPRTFNQVYDHLVEGDDDVIGLVAYALYKQDKREWLVAWRKSHSGDPTDDQLDAFVATQMTFGQRDRYRTAARQVLDAYASVAVDVERPLITQKAVAGRIESAATRVEAAGRWWRAIPGAFIGALLFAVIVAAVLVALAAAGVDAMQYLQPRSAG